MFFHLGQTVDVCLVDELVVGWGCAALVDAEEVLLGNIYQTGQENQNTTNK